MRVSCPVLVRRDASRDRAPGSSREKTASAGRVPFHEARPLFLPAPVAGGTTLSLVLARLGDKLQQKVREAAKERRHDRLEALLYAPSLHAREVGLALVLGRRTLRIRDLLIAVRHGGERLAFVPSLPEVWFRPAAGETLEAAAARVLTAHLRDKEREGGELADLEPGRAWLTTVDIEVAAGDFRPEERTPKRFSLGGPEEVSGEEELAKVGRCLDLLYPDGLACAIGRDAEVEELTRLLDDPDPRPVLLLGASGVGKSALVHTYVRRAVAARGGRPSAGKAASWLVRPSRLVAGMSYVGQWEDRWLAILEHARKRSLLLVVDDWMGLYRAGTHGQSTLCAAHVLRTFAERRPVRLLAEMTPAVHRLFQEIDRGFADRFRVVRVEEPSLERVLSILLALERDLERRHRTRFALDAIPRALELGRRFFRDTALPGSAAQILSGLAVKLGAAAAGGDQALEAIVELSGLPREIVDARRKLAREEVERALAAAVAGQPEAVAALAGAVVAWKARLNDPERPAGSLLFLGPTGVGKTQAAKALAAYLFGGEEQLLRFDLNQYADGGAAERLVGSRASPDGLLVAAVRQRPFAVVLLDEVEKAHPAVLDLLLQVLGEGRLSDALGRTADFSNTIVVLTSNLGAREAGSGAGFVPAAGAASAYRAAARSFLRPELFARIDEVVPFRRLPRAELRTVADALVRDVLAREGLARRRAVLVVEPAVLDRLALAGEHPELGARALKRTIEEELSRPLARRLARVPPGRPSVIEVRPGAGDAAIDVRVTELAPHPACAPPGALAGSAAEALPALERAAARLDREVAARKPEGPVSAGAIEARHVDYFAAREQLRAAQHALDRVRERLGARRPRIRHGLVVRHPVAARERPRRLPGADAAALLLAPDPGAWLSERLALLGPPPGDARPSPVEDAVLALALLEAMIAGTGPALVVARALGADPSARCDQLLARIGDWLGEPLRLESSLLDLGPRLPKVLVVEGAHALRLASLAAGVHLFEREGGGLVPVVVRAEPLPDPAAAAALARAMLDRGAADALPPVLRVHARGGLGFDLPSATLIRDPLDPDDARRLLLERLPPPPELAAPVPSEAARR